MIENHHGLSGGANPGYLSDIFQNYLKVVFNMGVEPFLSNNCLQWPGPEEVWGRGEHTVYRL